MVIEVLCTGLVVLDQPSWISLQKLRRSSEAGITWIGYVCFQGFLLLWYLAFKLPGCSRSQFLCSVLTLHLESILAIMSTDVGSGISFLNHCERVRHRKEKGITILKTWWVQSWKWTICWVYGFDTVIVAAISENALRNTVPKPALSVRLPVALWHGFWYNLQNLEQVSARFGSWIFSFFFFFVSSQSKMNWFSRFSLVLPEMDDCCDAVVIRSWIPLERPKVPKISGTLRGETLLRSTAHMSIHDYMGPHMILW